MNVRIRPVIHLACAAFFAGLTALSAADFPPTVAPPRPVHLPLPAVRVLANGLTVAVIERHELPIISLRLVVKSGPEADPPNLPGTAQFVGGLLDEGTTKRSAQEIARTIDHAGGTIESGADWDNSYVALRMLTDHTELAFDLVSDMVMHPAFASAEIERQRQQALSALSALRDDPAHVADTVFDRLAFEGTPYGHPADGTEDAIRRLTAQDIRDFYARNYRPTNSILAVVGDIRADEVLDLAARYFGEWRDDAGSAGPATSRSPSLPAVETARARRVIVVDKPDAVQTEIRIGNRGVPRNSPDYPALTVADQILGGPSTNRLYQALRIEHGLTYSASSDIDCFQTQGKWESKTSTRSAETMRSVHAMLNEMKRLREHTISDRELRTAQSYLTGHLALDVESSEDVAAQTLNVMVYNLAREYWNRFPDAIGKLEADDILTVAQRYLDVDRNIIVLVGNASSFGRELKNLGDVRVIPIHKLDLASPDLEQAAGSGGGR
jgi:zinc protease